MTTKTKCVCVNLKNILKKWKRSSENKKQKNRGKSEALEDRHEN